MPDCATMTTPATHIHPTAIIEEGAVVGPGVAVGPYAVIGALVTLGAGCRVGHHATVTGRTVLGGNNEIFPYACIGMRTQDLKYRGGEPGLRIGEGNVFREFCTIHAATNEDEETAIGDHNHFLAYTHVAHDCQLGNHIIMSNNATLAGHVEVADRVVLGGFAGVHQFCRIGRQAMIGGMTKITQDVPPFFIADGNPAAIRAVNVVGLERAGFSREEIDLVRKLHRIIYRDGLNRKQAIDRLAEHEQAETKLFAAMRQFLQEAGRGIVPGS